MCKYSSLWRPRTNSKPKQKCRKHHNTYILGDKTVYEKYMNTSARAGYTLPVWKWAQVQGLKESRLSIRGEEDQGLALRNSYWCLDGHFKYSDFLWLVRLQYIKLLYLHLTPCNKELVLWFLFQYSMEYKILESNVALKVTCKNNLL